MELLFLAILILLMVLSLAAGFPVAFALPGSAILAIAIAALCGLLFVGDPDAYFAQGSALQWLSAGVTNFRSLYWDVERDTLIAIPLFIFMGIMLQRSRIAEDLLVAMAQLFGPVPGGLGISVVLVGALLAATTGIVGATVIAMGLISLPAMLRNNYSKSLASGTICASGTLGQIIPPSIVLIILADQLASAAGQANTMRRAEYSAATGEYSMPAIFDVGSASAGDMFMGAFLPGLILVGIYVLYLFFYAMARPQDAPPVPCEGVRDRAFVLRLLRVLIPPLALIFTVLGSILLGIATVNQAGSIGAVGAIIMGSYRLAEGRKHCYTPALLAVGALVAIWVILSLFSVNIKSINSAADVLGVVLALIAVTVLLVAVGWSIWRVNAIDNTLSEVMVDTAKMTSMVFIILIGAAMLTAAFRGFGGEELVKHYLTSLPGGFWSQFLVVMLVIFLLGFFLDFIEIAVVVIPIVAPILLAEPSANITAVWFGVMVGLNIQTSFLTPPFGFALFYLRGVAPPQVKTTHIYKGSAAFIILQLLGLAIAGYWPSIVNYLPHRTYLTSETAPPPLNPLLQQCMEQTLFAYYDENETSLLAGIDQFAAVDTSYLPANLQIRLAESARQARATFDLVQDARMADARLAQYSDGYWSVHQQIRQVRRASANIDREIESLVDRRNRAQLKHQIAALREERARVEAQLPASWQEQNRRYKELYQAAQQARNRYRGNVDESYQVIVAVREMLTATAALQAFAPRFAALEAVLQGSDQRRAADAVRRMAGELLAIAGTEEIAARLSSISRLLTGDPVGWQAALHLLKEARALYRQELDWRPRAQQELLPLLEKYDDLVKSSIGLRLQKRLAKDQARAIARCQSVHRDISLNF